MKILSLFDGMSCGMLAMMAAGVRVERYDAYEIDKYAVTASKHNFPQIEHHGDVFKADFTEYRGYDFLIGGSPCTYWSIAQRPDKRETVASGLGWELFSQYVRALHEAQPRMFIYENNKSMSRDIRASITEAFGFEPICINSALVSAQNRQRLYWVGVRNEDGTYRKASIEQPEDRGILLKDVLDSAQPVTMDSGKGYALTASYGKANAADLHRGRNSQAAEPVGIKPLGGLNNSHQRRVVYDPTGKTPTLVAGAGAGGGNIPLVSEETPLHDKSRTLTANYWKTADPYVPTRQAAASRLAVAVAVHPITGEPLTIDPITGEPMRVPEATKAGYVDIQPGECVDLTQPNSKTRRGRRMEDKSNCLTAQEPEFYEYMGTAACVASRGRNPDNPSSRTAGDPTEQRLEAHEDGKTNTLTSVSKDNLIAEPMRVGTLPRGDGEVTNSRQYRAYSPDGKAVTQAAEAGGLGAKTGLYAVQEKPAKQQRVYEVKDGMIEVNGKRYPIKLRDGKYIIRKLTVTECMRLQTVPEWYDFSCVSATQAYKMLGNGWTVEVIAHLIRGAIRSSIFGV